jgi:hypothetical protein
VALHEGDYTATRSWPPSAAMMHLEEDTHPLGLAAQGAHASVTAAASGAYPGMTEWGAHEGDSQDRTELLAALEAESEHGE